MRSPVSLRIVLHEIAQPAGYDVCGNVLSNTVNMMADVSSAMLSLKEVQEALAASMAEVEERIKSITGLPPLDLSLDIPLSQLPVIPGAL